MNDQVCPKCSYQRQATDSNPEWQCPACGIEYSKFGPKAATSQDTSSVASPAKSSHRATQRKPSRGYVESTLMGGEEIIYKANIHWFVFVPGAVILVIGLIIVTVGIGDGTRPIGGTLALYVVGPYMLLKALIQKTTTELAVTTRRVIAKVGLIRRSTIELNHAKVESFHVDQSVLGRMFGFGTVVVNGTGGGQTPVPNIVAPLDFRHEAMWAIDQSQSR